MLAYRINASSTNSTYKSLYYVQTADIDLSAHYWDAIGTSSRYFSGHYDGGNLTISGLYTEAGSSSTYSYQGLFGYVRGQSNTNKAIIKNVGIIDSDIQGYQYIGGVVGDAYCSTIINCYNTGSVMGSGSEIYIGGVAGYAYSSDVINCYNAANVIGGEYVGGVVGDAASSAIITNCYNTDAVSGRNYVGGVVGESGSSDITNSYNTGTVTGGSSVGGVVGRAISSSAITNCYNIGSVKDYNGVSTREPIGDRYIGGVVGDAASSAIITNCYNTGSVTGSGSDLYAGGIVGSGGSATNNYYGGNCTLSYGIGSSSSNTGASKDENLIANAKSLSWYQDSSKWSSEYPWDFENTWTIANGINDGFPVLKYSIKASAITLNPNGGTGGMEVIYLSDNTFYADAGLSEPISKITSLPSWIGHKFEGFYTSPDGGVMVINSEGEIIADISSISSITTLYAQWSTAVSAYYDSEGGFWYVENGRLPQERVTDEMTIASLNSSITIGEVYYIAGMYLGSKVLNGEEYCLYNDVWYKVEPIKWRLQYSSSQQVGYASTTETLAIMAEIVYIDAFSDNVLGVGEGYTAESINSFMLYNKIDDSYLKTESRTVDLFGSTTLTTTTSVTSNMFVASYDELTNFTTNALNKTEKVGKTKISDFVKDYLRAEGKDAFYYIRDLGSNYNNIKCLGADGGLTQYKAQNKLGIQFSVKYTQYACL